METWGVEMENQSLLGYMVLANSGEFVLRLFLVSWCFLTAPVRRLSSGKSLLLPFPLLISLPLSLPLSLSLSSLLFPFTFLSFPSLSSPLFPSPSLFSFPVVLGMGPRSSCLPRKHSSFEPEIHPLWFLKVGVLLNHTGWTWTHSVAQIDISDSFSQVAGFAGLWYQWIVIFYILNAKILK